MKIINKKKHGKAGGKGYGTARRIKIVIMLLFLFTCILVGMYMYISYAMSKVVIPERMPGIPETAQWHGGPDGGAWIDIDTTKVPNQFHIRCYFDSTGALWEDGIFMLDSLTVQENYSVQKLHDIITGFGGDFWFYTEMYHKNPNFVFRKIKNFYIPDFR